MTITRRRLVVAGTLVAGTVLLGVSLSIRPGDPLFYVSTIAVALVWTVGGFASGPIPWGRVRVVVPVVTGLAAAAVFLLGALIVREIPVLRHEVEHVLAHASGGAVWAVAAVTVLNGIAEEIFFRGALYAAISRCPVWISTAIYTVATIATGNPMLVFAAATVGLLLGWQRRTTGGVLASAITHVVWSTTMLFALPVVLHP